MKNNPSSATQTQNPIIRHIRDNGAVSVGTYMAHALRHPKHGYYNTATPFNREGDFITAPEISQIFGEIIALFAATTWACQAKPEKWTLIECGPGNGTLIADILRTLNKLMPQDALPDIKLVEISPILIKKQKNLLKTHAPHIRWYQSVTDIFSQTAHPPFLLIANEFFDALETEQYIFHKNQWQQRVIDYNPKTRKLEFAKKSPHTPPHPLSHAMRNPKHNDILEWSPERERHMRMIAQAVRKHKGTALIIDYGYKNPHYGDSLQAISKHRTINALDNPGQCDLTTHVDFAALQHTAQQQHCAASDILTQSRFLKTLGAEIRAQKLMENKTKQQKYAIQSQLMRLINDRKPHDMGALFKVLCVSHKAEAMPFPFTARTTIKDNST